MVEPLRRVMVRRPTEDFGAANPAHWHYAGRPDLASAHREHDALVELLAADGVDVSYHDTDLPGLADAIFVHDPVIVTERGAIALRMGKELRRGEEAALAAALARSGVPLAGTLTEPAIAEGGDLLWLDRTTLAVGQGFRTNRHALTQLTPLLPGVELIPVELPYGAGPDACLHLMSLISLVDHDLAVVYRPMLPISFLQLLEGRGYRFVDVPEAELASHGTNVLAVAPRNCLMLDGNRITAERLDAAGCTVRTYVGNEITLKAEGGATCLTRPVLRG